MGVPAPAGSVTQGRSPYFPDDKANTVVEATFAAVGPGKAAGFYGPLNLFIWAEFSTTIDVTAGSSTVVLTAAGVVSAGAAINSAHLPPGTTVQSIVALDAVVALPTISMSGKVTLGGTSIKGLASTDWLLNATVTGHGIPASTEVSSIDVVADMTANPPRFGEVTINNAVTAVRADWDGNEQFEFALENDGLTTVLNAAATVTGAGVVYNATVQLERSFDGGATWLPCNVGGSGTLAQWNAGTPVSIAFGEPEKFMYYRLNCLAYTGVADTTLNYRLSETGQAAMSLSLPTL